MVKYTMNRVAFADMHAAVAQGAFVSPRAVDVSAEALDASVAAVEADRRVAEAFLAEPWPQLAEFLQRGGTDTLLGLIQHTPGERYAALASCISSLDCYPSSTRSCCYSPETHCTTYLEVAARHAGCSQQAPTLGPCPACIQGLNRLGMRRYCNEIARHALEVLQLLTLAPAARHRLLEAFPEPGAAGHTDGVSVLLDVAHGVPYSNDPEVSTSYPSRSWEDPF